MKFITENDILFLRTLVHCLSTTYGKPDLVPSLGERWGGDYLFTQLSQGHFFTSTNNKLRIAPIRCKWVGTSPASQVRKNIDPVSEVQKPSNPEH